MKTNSQLAIDFVRDMAESSPSRKSTDRGKTVWHCRYCNSNQTCSKEVEGHDDRCPWIRARKIREGLKVEGLLI